MRVGLEFKIKKKVYHVLLFPLLAIGLVLLFIGSEFAELFFIGLKYIAYILIIVAIIAIIIALFYFPKSINLTYQIIIKYLLVRSKEINFYDVKGYELHDLLPFIIILNLKNGKTISFFYDKEDYEYIQEYFNSHGIKKL